MATEHLAVPLLIKRFNELYRDRIKSELTFEEFKQNFHGLARESLCLNLSKYYNIQVDFQTLYEDREWRLMEMLQETGVQMADNLVETLDVLEKTGYRFAFVSNNPIQRGLASMRYATNGQGEKLARFFGDAFFEAGDTQKPQPHVYIRAMKQLRINPKDCYAIEDSATGVKAAVGAGIETFGFLEFADNPQDMENKLLEAGAKKCFHNWKDLPSLII